MKNCRKRKSRLRDERLFQSHQFLKQPKARKLLNSTVCGLSRNWNEVKVVLDRTIVEHYLINKQSISKDSTRVPKDDECTMQNEKKLLVRSHNICDETRLFSKTCEKNQNIRDSISENSINFVKVENPADGLDHLLSNDTFDFVDVDKLNVDNGSNSENIHFEEFTESLDDNFQCQDDKSSVIQLVKAEFKDDMTESSNCLFSNEDIIVSQEFKHHDFMLSYDDTMLDNQNNDFKDGEVPCNSLSLRSTRSIMNKKKCIDCDDCDHRNLRKAQLSTRINNKHRSKSCTVDGSKRSNQSKIVTKTGQHEPRNISPSLRLFDGDHCEYKSTRKLLTSRHISRKHPLRFPMHCSNCNRTFRQLKRFKQHKLLCQPMFYFKCKFCSFSFRRKYGMKMHLKDVHFHKLDDRRLSEITDDIWYGAARDIENALKFENNTQKQRIFAMRFLRSNPNYYVWKKEIKSHCVNCKTTYENIETKNQSCCYNCSDPLVYQCSTCRITRESFQDIQQHLLKNLCRLSVKRTNDSQQKYYYCNECDRKEKSKFLIRRHILFDHISNCVKNDDAESGNTEILHKNSAIHHEEIVTKITNKSKNVQKDNGKFTCLECNEQFRSRLVFEEHKCKCQTETFYKCQFCYLWSPSLKTMEIHIFTKHAELVSEDTKDLIMQQIEKNKKIHNIAFKTHVGFVCKDIKAAEDTVRNKGAEAVNLIKFYCTKCEKFVRNETRERIYYCPNCCVALEMECRNCAIRYSSWLYAVNHTTSRTCINRKSAVKQNLPTHLLDHSYTPI